MTQEEITQGNRLITEFMEFEISENGNCFKCPNQKGWILIPDTLSWNWLMPVVEKIDKTVLDGMELCTVIEGESCTVLGTPVFCEGKTKLEATWLAVVKFIKWYNKQ